MDGYCERNANLADCDFLLGFINSFGTARTAVCDRCAADAATHRSWTLWRYTAQSVNCTKSLIIDHIVAVSIK